MKKISDSIQKLIDGNKEFKQHYYRDHTSLFENLVENGQSPKVMIIACCDARVDPTILTNSKPGELFMVRNVANLVPPCDHNPHSHQHSTSSALEFAVRSLEVEHIIIFGHRYCGGIQALMKRSSGIHPNTFIDAWMDIAEPARQTVLAEYGNLDPVEQAHRCEELAPLISLQNLLSFPWIAEKVAAKKLELHVWYFDLQEGLIRRYDSATHTYQILE